MLKATISILLLASTFFAAALFALEQQPKSIVYKDYPTKQCLMVDIVVDKKYKRISCAEFDFTQPYITEWGGVQH